MPHGRAHVLAAAAALLLAATLTGSGLAEPSPVGHVDAQEGEVLAQRPGEARELRHGMAVFRDDALITGNRAKVRIAFDDGSAMTVGPETRVEVERFAPGSAGLFDLIYGAVRILLTDSDGGRDVSVRARTATASVRSTGLIVSTDPQTTGVFVLEGRVSVSAPGHDETVGLQAGQGSDIPLGEPPGRAKRWPPARVEALRARTRIE
jgi:hypothetical protein